MLFGGNISPKQQTEIWDGTSWTEVNDLNTGRSDGGGATGPTLSSLYFGGNPNRNETEYWDGTSWTEVNNLGTGRQDTSGCGASGKNAICVGGIDATPPAGLANVEEWTVDLTNQTITTS